MATLYYNAAVDTDWATLGNWWQNAAHTVAATALPTSDDSVVISASVSSNAGSTPTVANMTVGNAAFAIAATVTGDCLFSSGGSLLAGGAITGNVTFAADSSQSYGSGNVTGDVTFQGAEFIGNPLGSLTVSGTVTFPSETPVAISAPYGWSEDTSNWVFATPGQTFTLTGSNSGTIYGTVIFNDGDNANGVVNGHAIFNSSGTNVGEVNGDITINSGNWTAAGPSELIRATGATVTVNGGNMGIGCSGASLTMNGGTLGDPALTQYAPMMNGLFLATFNGNSAVRWAENFQCPMTFNDNSSLGQAGDNVTFSIYSSLQYQSSVTFNDDSRFVSFGDGTGPNITINAPVTFNGRSFNNSCINNTVTVNRQYGVNGSSILGVV